MRREDREDMKKENPPKNSRLIQCISNTTRSFAASLPTLLGVVLLMGMFRANVSKEMLFRLFGGGAFRDTLVGSVAGSISAGNALTSYIIGGEILTQGGSLFAVTAFLVAWVTVGIIQLPAEASLLGRRFAVARNFVSFLLVFPVSIATVLTLLALH
jgi:uncharacterized membrane protein YraQ (UPF0718 family)